MSNWPLQGGGRVAVGFDGRAGTLLAKAAANHTPSEWQEVVGATPVSASGLLIALWAGANLGKRGLCDIAVGAAGVERMLIEGLPVGPGAQIAEAMGLSAPLFVPLSVPRGSRISARWQSSGMDGTVGLSLPDLVIHLLPPHPLGLTGATYSETLGLNRANSCGVAVTSGTSWGAWYEVGTLSRRAFALIPCVFASTDSTPRNQIGVQFGVGPIESRVPIAEQSLRIDTANQVSLNCLGHVYTDAAAGTTLWARANCSTTRTLNCHVIAIS